MTTTPRRRLTATALAAAAALVLAACGSGGGESDETISIVGFAVPEAANKAIAEKFNETPEGEGVRFKTSYGASGDQSRAVVDGLKADYVHLSVATDVDRLVDAGLVEDTWDDGENKGIVSTSIVVLGVREGNPKNIQGWDDLVKPGVEIVTANPASSGAARWNALAAWGSVTENGGSKAEATEYIDRLFKNVVSLTNSGRDATQSFLGGTGDVLLAYENEAILAAQQGQGFDYVIPETTLLIENPGALLTKHTPAAESWLDFVLGETGQREFALKGFRPLNLEEPGTADLESVGLEASDIKGAPDPADPFPAVKNLLTLTDNFGGPGWGGVKDELFGDGKDGAPVGIVTDAISKSGKASQ
ncbi:MULTISPECIES: sulfate ABC transporter substrate-binding protein [unclassified Aeromicrobium]|uniref:sulfate ABC transporter substrate-binding protein n=1 Tax=unclassified Aeromicrobium TaxID=2633570 RepID=UPI0006FE0647|nr:MULTISPECIES: sulfate ABC transporter substrate-binding protein [unclassified Aeromicrobium]KQO42039.1 sulfate ABC transporter substrate-binding protein [Aeromicrobium sp. Leaf245]KQP74910.1 sulfate ABC transporter substrate-binding protein [Aeromicrobium sp. Leaf289]